MDAQIFWMWFLLPPLILSYCGISVIAVLCFFVYHKLIILSPYTCHAHSRKQRRCYLSMDSKTVSFYSKVNILL